ncbi:glycosyl transferase family 1 [Melittangium boletus DSM 14713]|uniref:Glycosyl transferase family 1 n=1 Tax=Melittangium boletus DSM 14713 TaxID=1294270 RepID=A0A250ILH9_9BACT|nr:glycosyl transferase family 1 [Melittangium boletus DSM 14713]
MRRPVSIGPVAFDASLWDEPITGIGLYTHCLAEALGSLGVRLERYGARVSGEDPRGTLGRTAYVLGRLPQALRGSEARLYHALGNFNLPLVRTPGKPFVVTVHDVIPLLMPDTVSRAYRWQFQLWLARSVQVADRVLCVSACTRDDLLARHPEAADKVAVVYNGVDHVDRHGAEDATRALLDAWGLPERFVLYAGSLDVRKNVRLVLDALERLAARGRKVPLVLVGQRWFGSGEVETRVERLRARGHDIRSLGYQPESVFYELMRRATVFAFPSRYEGFGLPPLEAMRLGTPAIVSTTGASPEVCGEGAWAVRPEDAEGLSVAMERLMHSDAERRHWAEKGQRHAARFTWARCAADTLAAYEHVLRR